MQCKAKNTLFNAVPDATKTQLSYYISLLIYAEKQLKKSSLRNATHNNITAFYATSCRLFAKVLSQEDTPGDAFWDHI